MRKREYYLIAGSIFAVWQRIENQINKHARSTITQKLQVVRLKTAEGRKIVGVLIPKTCVSHIIGDLKTDSVPTDLGAAQASDQKQIPLFVVPSKDLKTDSVPADLVAAQASDRKKIPLFAIPSDNESKN